MAAQDLVDDYTRRFRARVAAMRQPGQRLVDQPGIVALIGTGAHTLDGRALVTGDQALPVLQDLGTGLAARVVTVFGAARRCHRLLSETGAYRAESCTAMVRDDLGTVAAPSLPEGLTLRTVSRTHEPGEGVGIEEAAASVLCSDPTIAPFEDLDGFVAYLRSVPEARFLAATDAAGVVRATAAATMFDVTAGVFFVNTDPGWRGRGVGTSMTAAALVAAAEAGARNASLDASALGLSLYLRLGFSAVSPATLFSRKD